MKRLLYSLLLPFILSVAVAQSQVDTLQRIQASRTNSKEQQQKPYVILISCDGFRFDYAKKYNAQYLTKLADQGVRASSMIPSFPSLTYPNHYSIITGMYPSHHGLVNNIFYDKTKKSVYTMSDRAKVRDSSWYGGTPLWVLAEQQRMITASLFWVGTEAAIKGVRPTYYYDYNEKITIDQRIKIVTDWLSLPADKRPHFISFYLSEPDHSGHTFGPESTETATAVRMVDSVIYRLTEAVKSTGLPVNFIFTSDHGMTKVDQEHPLPIPASIDTSKFIIPSTGTLLVLHANEKKDILPLYKTLKKQEQHYSVYLKSNTPVYLHYRDEDDRFDRMGDIMLIPDWPYVFASKKPHPGYHGFDPTRVKDMHASFAAWGPAFKKGIKIPAFENVHVYPLIASILNLPYTEVIDGRKEVLQDILK